MSAVMTKARCRHRLRSTWAVLTLVATFSSTGCYKASFIEPKARASVEHDEWTDFFLFGLVGSEEVDVRRYCEDPPARVRTGGNFGTGIVSLLTLGIYTPRKFYVTCATKGSAPTRKTQEREADHDSGATTDTDAAPASIEEVSLSMDSEESQ